MPSTVDITPSPRVLRMLGQIDFAPWQCLAELIDNSIDSFIDLQSQGDAAIRPRISIDLPADSELRDGSGTISIRDNGPGMTLLQLENAVRAGYSGNDPVEKMGLFGMGFNISTARLGRRTEIWTTTAESEDWVGLVIDFDELEQTRSFSATVRSREKTQAEIENSSHGTEVRIDKLEALRTRPLMWGAGKANTRKRLGKIYGRVMANLGIEISYDGDRITPWRHCTWNATRTVPTSDFGNVPARLAIEESLPPRRFCTMCWVWLEGREEECPACGSTDNLIERQRIISGWIGVQRYFDKDHYGIDLIRNGRVIENLEKSMFTFADANGDESLEYPIDATHWGGRIVGELEIDFVRVSHQKDSFDKLDPEWKHVLTSVRGNAPLRPRIAQQMGYSPNASPLARLFAGYRAGHAGLKELVPGDANGQGLNSGPVLDWVERFYRGETEYQSDEKWYELVLQAERAKRGDSSGDEEAAGELPIVDDDTDTDNGNGEEDNDSQTEDEQEPQYEDEVELSKTLELEELPGSPMIAVSSRRIVDGELGYPFRAELSGARVRFDYDPQNQFFEESLETPLDCLLKELAYYFLTLSAETPRNWPLSIIERRLRRKYFPETLTDVDMLGDTASALLSELRNQFEESLPEIAPIDSAIIDSQTLERIRQRALTEDLGDDEFVNQIVEGGRFTKYVDNRFLLTMVSTFPELVLDGNFLNPPFANLDSNLRKEVISMVQNGLEDVRWLSEEGSGAVSKDAAWRLRYGRALASLRMMQSWRS